MKLSSKSKNVYFLSSHLYRDKTIISEKGKLKIFSNFGGGLEEEANFESFLFRANPFEIHLVDIVKIRSLKYFILFKKKKKKKKKFP